MNRRATEVRLADAARDAVKKGLFAVADAVAATLGPRGKSVLIDTGTGLCATKDGEKVAQSIVFENAAENVGAEAVRMVASKTDGAAGDGTTTATVLTRAIFEEGLRRLQRGTNIVDMQRGILRGIARARSFVEQRAVPAAGKDILERVATVSANGDADIGKIVATAVAATGKGGAIRVEQGTRAADVLDIAEGLVLPDGYVSPYFANSSDGRCSLDDALVLVAKGRVSRAADVVPALELAAKKERPLVVAAEDVDGEALATLVVNRLRGAAVCALRIPGYGLAASEWTEDFAAVSGAAVFDAAAGVSPADVQEQHLGVLKRLVATKDQATAVYADAGRGTQKAAELRALLAEAHGEYEQRQLRERIARLTGGVATIRVGGLLGLDIGERCDRMRDAVGAARAALAKGVVPGGGTLLVKAAQALAETEQGAETACVAEGVRTVREALLRPVQTIAANAGRSGEIIVQRLLAESNPDVGYDARNNEFADLSARGILDPAAVVSAALENAAAVSVLLLGTAAVVTQKPCK